MSTHNELKEAIQSALNAANTYRGIAIGTAQITRKEAYTADDSGNYTAESGTARIVPSDEVKALIDAHLDAQAPAPAPVPAQPPAPVPSPAPAPAPPPSGAGQGTHLVILKAIEVATKRAWFAQTHVGDDPTVAGQFIAFTDADGNPHPALKADIYADCCHASVRGAENPYDYLGFELSVEYDGVEVDMPPTSNDDGTVDFWVGCWGPAIRYGQQVPFDASRIDWSLLPSYDRTPQTPYSDSGKDYTYNGLGCASGAGMSTTGERGDIGYMSQWNMAFITNPSQETWDVVRRADDWAGNWPIYFGEPDTGRILDIDTYPDATTLPPAQSGSWKDNPIARYGGSYRGDTLTPAASTWRNTACPNTPNGAHLTSYALLTAMVTGTAHDRDNASFWANWPLLEINPAYTQSGGVMLGPQRRAAWCLRSLFMAGYVSADGAYFQRQTARQLEIANGIERNAFGLMNTHAAYVGEGAAKGCKGLAIWMQDYMMEVLDPVAHKLPGWQPFAQFLGSFYAQWGKLPQAPMTTIYSWICRDASGALIPDPMQQLRYSLISNKFSEDEAATVIAADATEQDVFNVINAHYANWGGKMQDGISDYRGYILAADSYPAGMIAATIAAANVGTPGIDAALHRVLNLPTKPDYSANQKYHLVLRTPAQ